LGIGIWGDGLFSGRKSWETTEEGRPRT
jgi:hypothetical protein